MYTCSPLPFLSKEGHENHPKEKVNLPPLSLFIIGIARSYYKRLLLHISVVPHHTSNFQHQQHQMKSGTALVLIAGILSPMFTLLGTHHDHG